MVPPFVYLEPIQVHFPAGMLLMYCRIQFLVPLLGIVLGIFRIAAIFLSHFSRADRITLLT